MWTLVADPLSILEIIISSYMIFIMIFLIMFTLGGSTGVILGNAVVDVSLHGT